MRVLLVEPQYRRKAGGVAGGGKKNKKVSDETLWYPPIGLMKLARYHKQRGDTVRFISGIDNSLVPSGDFFNNDILWDRVYVATLFTFHYKKVVDTINFYKDIVGGTSKKIFVGGIMATLMQDDIFENTGVMPLPGLITSARQIGMNDDTNIDRLAPDYSLLDAQQYAINDTFYAYTTKGCSNKCSWCAVPKLEPVYEDYVDIKPVINILRDECGDFSRLKLMDNNTLVSNRLEDIVNDLVNLGYGRGEKTSTGKARVVDFNQGTDASHIDEKTIALLAKLNIKPLRIAFDQVKEEKLYRNAVELAFKNGFTEISNYMLYNFKDKPIDLYKRILVNIELNEKWAKPDKNGNYGQIYCYPMRFAPINQSLGRHTNRKRDFFPNVDSHTVDWLNQPRWNKRFVRNIEVIKGAAHGAISTTPSLARRSIGRNWEEFITNLYMPEHMLRYRNKYEKTIAEGEPERIPGNGIIEEFRQFVLELLKKQNGRFYIFHNAVCAYSKAEIRKAIDKLPTDKEMLKWLEYYLKN